MRTAENDNDKATKYFKDPAASLKEKYSAAQLQSIDDGETKKVIMASDGTELIERLKQQSADNKDRNDKIIRAKTLQNDMVCLNFFSSFYLFPVFIHYRTCFTLILMVHETM